MLIAGQVIVTGALDKEVRMHTAPFAETLETTKSYSCHDGRVKDIEVQDSA